MNPSSIPLRHHHLPHLCRMIMTSTHHRLLASILQSSPLMCFPSLPVSCLPLVSVLTVRLLSIPRPSLWRPPRRTLTTNRPNRRRRTTVSLACKATGRIRPKSTVTLVRRIVRARLWLVGAVRSGRRSHSHRGLMHHSHLLSA